MWDDPKSGDEAELFFALRPASPPAAGSQVYAPLSFNAAATEGGLLLRFTDGEREMDVAFTRFLSQALIILVARAAAAQDWFPDPDAPDPEDAPGGPADRAPGLVPGLPANDPGPGRAT